MTITLNDEQARLLDEVVNAGIARSPEEAVDQAVRALHSSTTGKRPVHPHVDNLADLFAKSPFHGLDMDFEREQDTGRDIAL
jgi:Arc/MetJ-type ribon-helix-helix transcriptional regulator